MTAFVICFILAFVLLASGGLLLLDDTNTPRSIESILSSPDETRNPKNRLRGAFAPVGRALRLLEKVLPRSSSDMSEIQARLIRAGFREGHAVRYFSGVRLACMTLLPAVLLLTIRASHPFLTIVAGIGIGYLAPDAWLSRRVKSRNAALRRELPDFLDLLIVCVEAGLSLDQALIRTTGEMRRTQSAICDEFSLVILEQQAGCVRTEAWKHLADRTNEESVRNVVSMLVQSEQFGTSIAKALRVHAESLRTQRIQQVEEQAAKTTVKMLFPLVLLIFPAIFVVTLGPAMILMVESFQNNMNH